MSVQKIIQEAINKSPLDLKEALEEELRNRIRLALEAKMEDEKDDDEEDDDSSDEEDDEEEDDEKDMKEEAEQIDEISGATLGSYMVKARKSAAAARQKDDDSYNNPETDNKEYRRPIRRTIRKREHGIGRANDKLQGSSWAKVPAGEK